MKSQGCPLKLLLLSTFLITLQPILTTADGSDFIRTSCITTRYPDVCYESLAPYAATIGTDLGQLALKSVAVSLSQVKPVAAHVASIKVDSGRDPELFAGVNGCAELLGDVVDEINDALGQMSKLVPPPAAPVHSFKLKVTEVKVTMSAALADEDTCIEGFEDVDDGPVKADVLNRVVKVKKYGSIALAFIAQYAEEGKSLR